jgi:superfamily II DNA or RNA helicase
MQANPLKLQAKHIINVAIQNTKLVLKVVSCQLGTRSKNGITPVNLTKKKYKITDTFDLVIMDESHRFGAFPKPSQRTKDFNLPF